MPYPWRSRRVSVRRINMSSEPGNESFFCALRPIPRILSLRQRDETNQVKICKPSRRKTDFGVLTRAGCESLWRAFPAVDEEATSDFKRRRKSVRAVRPRTVFASEAVKRSSDSTARVYLNAVIPLFDWMEKDE